MRTLSGVAASEMGGRRLMGLISAVALIGLVVALMIREAAERQTKKKDR